MPSLRPSLKVVKSFSYRGAPRLWSNRYHFGGVTPADSAHWTTFSDAVVTAEKAMLGDFQTIVQTVGYDSGSDVPVFTKTYATAGTFVSTSLARQQGEVAYLIRYATATRTSKNHPLYLFNYYHGAIANALTTPDVIRTVLANACDTYAGLWIAGFSDGTNVHPRMGPNGDLALGSLTETNLTHRDFPRA